MIRNNEQLYIDLRRVLARQPSSEANEQLRIFEAAIKEKKARHSAMQAELKLYQAKVYEVKNEIEQINKQLDLVKLSYFAKKRNEARFLEDPSTEQGPALQPIYDTYEAVDKEVDYPGEGPVDKAAATFKDKRSNDDEGDEQQHTKQDSEIDSFGLPLEGSS